MSGFRAGRGWVLPALVGAAVVISVVGGVTWGFASLSQAQTGPARETPPVPLRLLDDSVITTIPVGANPAGVAYDSRTGDVYVSIYSSDNLTVINGSTEKTTNSLIVGDNPGPLAYDSENGYLYIATTENNNISVYDPASQTLIASIHVGFYPSFVVADSSNGNVFLSNYNGGSVTVINASTESLAETTTGGMSGPLGMVYDPISGNVVVSNSGYGNLTELNGSTGALVGWSQPSSPPPYGIAFDPRNNELYSTGSGGDVGVYNGTTLAPVTDIGVPFHMDYVAAVYDDRNEYVYAVNPSDASVAILDTVTNQLRISEPGGAGASSLDFDQDNGNVYVANSGAGTVTVLNGTFRYPSISNFTASPTALVVGSTTALRANTSGGNGELAYRYTGLPPGCSSSNTADLLCTPSRVGSYSVRVFVNDSGGNSINASVALSVEQFPINSFVAIPSSVVVGSSTEFQVNASGGYVALGYQYTGLPPGCASSDTATLICTPQRAGSYTVGVFVNDSGGNSVNTTTPLTVTDFPITSFTATPSTVDVGTSTVLAVSAVIGSGTLGYKFTGLPQGCISASTPTLHCIPSSPGSYSIRVFVNDTGGDSVNSSLTLTVNPTPTVLIAANHSPTDAMSPVTLSASVSGGTGPFVYAWLIDASPVPGGAALAYTFNSSGSYQIQVFANDSLDVGATATFNLTVDSALAATLAVSNSTPLLGQTIAFVTNATGGANTYNYSYTGFPPGCVSFDQAAIGCLPTQAGNYTVSVDVTDGNGDSVTARVGVRVVFDFNVVVPANLSVGSNFTISVNTNESFSDGTAVTPAEGFGTFTYSYTGLPPGCSNENAPTISCDPTQAGVYHVTISVHDEVGDHQTHTVVVDIGNAVPPSPGSSAGVTGIETYLIIGGAAALALGIGALWAIRARYSKAPPSK